MFKKLICLLVLISMVVSAVPAYAKSEDRAFSRDTVITQDNIAQVLKHYGLDFNKATKNTSKIMTHTRFAGHSRVRVK